MPARRRRPKIAPALPPRGASLEYTREVMSWFRAVRDAVREHVVPELPDFAAVAPPPPERDRSREIARAGERSGLRMDAPPRLPRSISRSAESLMDLVRREVRGRLTDERVAGAMLRISHRVDVHVMSELVRQLRAAGLPSITRTPQVSTAIRSVFIRQNVALVGDVTRREIDTIQDLVANAATRGLTHEQLARAIARQTDVTEGRAAFIARDQILTLNGQLTRLRQESAGIKRYIWRTSRDARVRPAHEALEGTVQLWADPPIMSDDGRTGHPGDDYLCRCTAEPIIDELLEA